MLAPELLVIVATFVPLDRDDALAWIAKRSE